MKEFYNNTAPVLDLILTLLKRKWLIIANTIIGTLLMYGIAWLMPIWWQSQAVLYSSILILKSREPPIFTGEMYDVYKSICVRTASKILTQRRVSDLISELDMLGIINAKVISKGRYGRTREIRLSVSDDVALSIEKVLKTELSL